MLALLIILVVPISTAYQPNIHYLPSETSLITSQDDVECAAWVIWDEARNQGADGLRAVLDVVITRMTMYDMTACEVIKQPHQFSGYKKGMKLKITNNMLTQYRFISNMKPVVENAEFFHSVDVSPSWKNRLQRIKQIHNHIFYKHKEQ